MLARTCKQKIPKANKKGVQSILAKVGASEALMGDGVAVCCKDVVISVRRVRKNRDMLHCEQEHSYIWAYSQSIL